jgi:hypothetical protein
VDDPCYLTVASAHVNRVAAVALLELVAAGASAGIAISLIRSQGGGVLVWPLPLGSPVYRSGSFSKVRASCWRSGTSATPVLTRRIKDQILGVNGARLYGIEPNRWEFSRRELERLRRHLPGRNRTLGPSTAAKAGAFTQRPHA